MSVKLITLGIGEKSIFLGFLRCKASGKVSQGTKDLRQESDPLTPGDAIRSGESAEIELFPSAQDFYDSMYNYGD